MTDRAKTCYIETYGCQMNEADSELMTGVLAGAGYVPVDRPEEADVILLNTCAIREHAEQRVLGRATDLHRLRRERPRLVLGVCGCMAQRLGRRLLERSSFVDFVVGPDAYRALPEIIDRAGRREDGRLAVVDFNPAENYEDLEVRRQSKVSAWVPIQRGCDYRCTFCIVPYTRGSEKNREPAKILDEVRRIADQGITEVTLLGQTVNSYRYEEWDFARLLRAVACVPGIRRVRFTSPHPCDFTEALARMMGEEPALCPHLHLPVQSGSNAVLKRMLRRYTREEYLAKIEMARAHVPEIAITTDIIVGFPGESDREFEDTLSLAREVRYDEAYTFKFSPREGTPATRMPPEWNVPDAVARQRLERLIAVVREIAARKNAEEVGSVREVLVEKKAKRGELLQARTPQNKVVLLQGPEEWMGRYMEVILTGTTGATFTGAPLL